MNDDSRLVYSSDPTINKKCLKCKELMSECTCLLDEDPQDFQGSAKLRMEKAGRGGKTVTVVDHLPRNDQFLKKLTSKIKSQCGTGGTYRIEKNGGMIEIQGEKRDVIRALLLKEKIKCKG